jgi:hypothetical protein
LRLYILPQHSHINGVGVFGGATGISESDGNASSIATGSTAVGGGRGRGGVSSREIEVFLICLLERKCLSICFLLHV